MRQPNILREDGAFTVKYAPMLCNAVTKAKAQSPWCFACAIGNTATLDGGPSRNCTAYVHFTG
jgi:hypothetical protein